MFDKEAAVSSLYVFKFFVKKGYLIIQNPAKREGNLFKIENDHLNFHK